jgi:Flp pilus assembly protein TadG
MRVRDKKRSGSAVVELAIILPLLAFLFAIGIDFARLYYDLVTIHNAARSGAMYGAQHPAKATDTAGIQAAALADSKNLKPAATVKSKTGTDELGYPGVNVTVAWTFKTFTSFPLVPSTVDLSRTVQMRIGPAQPKEVPY